MVTRSWALIIPGSQQASIGCACCRKTIVHRKRTAQDTQKDCPARPQRTINLLRGGWDDPNCARPTRGVCDRALREHGDRPSYPAPFSASCCASCAALGPMVGYGRCIWSGGKACGRRTGRRICRSGSAGWERTRPSLRHFADRVGGTVPPRGGALRSTPGFGHSRHLFILRHFTGQLLDDVDGGTAGSAAASDAAESAASERHY